MTSYVICDHGLIEASIVPPECLGSPGKAPAGIYHTFFRHDGYTGLADLRFRYFGEQMKLLGYAPEEFTESIFNGDLTEELLEREGIKASPSRLRVMIFDEPVTLADGRQTKAMSFLRPATFPLEMRTPFRCAVAPRRRIEIADNWGLKRLGRNQIDLDVEAAKQNGFDDVLYLDRMGQWCEAAYANIVAVFGKRICIVAPEGLSYQGLTCGALNLIKKELRPLQVHHMGLDKAKIAEADEVFLTSAVRGLQPVTEIDGIGKWEIDVQSSVCRRITDIMTDMAII